MPSVRIWMILAAAAAAAGPGARESLAETLSGSSKDELAAGDWRGEKQWEHRESAGTGTATPAPGTTAPPPGGTATPPRTGSEPSPAGTPTEPTGPAEPTEPASPSPEEAPAQPVPPLPPAPAPTLTPVVGTCNARWVYEVREPRASLYEEETLLTITLFRTDSFAFISNGYCRSESTWYADVFATTQAGHTGMAEFMVELRIEGPCPNCRPKIGLKGISQLQARVQAKTPWGGLDSSTTAAAAASTLWAGDIDCGDRCAASISGGQGTGEVTVGADPLKITRKTTASYVFVDVDGGKGDAARIDQARTSLMIVNRGSVSTFAAGTDDNAQAKSRAGYFLVLQGESACGKWGEYQVVIRE